jgi:hypothetical protein
MTMGHIVNSLENNDLRRKFKFLTTAFGFICVLLTGLIAGAQDEIIPTKANIALEAEASSSRYPALIVQKSDHNVVSFGYDHLVHNWVKITQGVQPTERFLLKTAGFASAGTPGSASVPHSGGWIVVPPGKSPQLHIVSEKWSSAEGRPLAVVSVPYRVGSEATDDASFSGLSVLPHEELPSDVPFPSSIQAEFSTRNHSRSGSAVQLGEVIWWRGRRIVSYSVIPVRYDNNALATETLDSGSWEVKFVEDKAALDATIPPHHAQKKTTRLDDQLGASFLNSELLKGLSTEAVFRGPGKFAQPAPASLEKMRGDKSGTLKGPEIRIPVSASMLFKVAYSTLADNNLLPAGVSLLESDVRMYQRRYVAALDDGSGQAPYAEIEVPVHMVGDGDGFSGDDFFIFYGLRSRDDREFAMDVDGESLTFPGAGDPFEANNDANIYWLAFSTADVGEDWARMDVSSLPATTITPLTSYSRSEHKEEAVTFRGAVPNQTSDRIVNNNNWDYSTNILIAPLYSPDPAGADVSLKLSIAGHSTDYRTGYFSLETDDLPPTDLGTFTTSSQNEVYFNTTVPISAIAGESTKLIMDSVVYGVLLNMYLNYVEITYDALYQATGNHLLFHGTESAGPQPMQVTGFGNDAFGLIELTNPRQPVFVALDAANLIPDGENVTLSIQPDQFIDQKVYYAHGDLLGNGVSNFAYWLAEVVENPANPTILSGADPALVVVTPQEFRAGIEPWIEHRKARAGGNLEVHTVLAQDLYDYYSGGMHDAWAIKRFAAHAITQWGSYALQLVGDGNENMRELGVNPGGRPYATDWIPTHYHNQSSTGYQPELLGSDKWYATFEFTGTYPFDNFPDLVRAPWEMLVGRFPCNSNEELANIIAKIQAVENPQPDQSWRKRGIFFADDAWSNGWGANAQTYLTHKASEEIFATSARDSLGPWWGDGTGVTMVVDTLDLAVWLDPHWSEEQGTLRVREEFKNYTAEEAYPPLLNSLNAGGLIAHFQGHGSGYVLCSEFWFKDQNAGDYVMNVGDLSNNFRPWVFFGMGCHIADWCRNTAIFGSFYKEPSLSEKFLVRAGSGASAAYASSGYEYIPTNRLFGEVIFKLWTLHPPVTRGAGGLMNNRSRWVLGELLWAAEAEMMSWGGFYNHTREAVAQFTILGDPLMVLDGGEPEVSAVLHGPSNEDISDSVDLVAIDASNKRTVTIVARDEAGIDRIELVDSDGNDLSAYVISETVPEGSTSHQVVSYSLELDVLPYEHIIIAKVYDTGGSLPGDRHYELLFNIHQTGEFTSSGESVDPAVFVFRVDEPVDFNGLVTSAAWLSEDMDVSLSGEHLIITNEVFSYDKSNEMAFSFTAEENGETDEARAVVLHIDGNDTRYILSEGTGELTEAGITGVYSYPNPLQDATRFVYESNSAGGAGHVRIFSMGGRQVASLSFTLNGSDNGGVIPWDGRDSLGDELGNGTYLYRLELETASGQLVSEMQRLVIMR